MRRWKKCCQRGWRIPRRWHPAGHNNRLLLLPSAYSFLPSALLLHARTLNWISRVLPRRQSTKQSRRVIYSFGFEFEHRPGARMFVWSSTVSSNQLVARQIRDMIQDRAGGHRNRSLDMFLLVCRVSTRVDDEYIIRKPKFVELVDANSPRIVGRTACGRGLLCRSLREKRFV